MKEQRPGMRWVEGGTFAMGSEEFYPEERPVHAVTLDGLWIGEHPAIVFQPTSGPAPLNDYRQLWGWSASWTSHPIAFGSGEWICAVASSRTAAAW